MRKLAHLTRGRLGCMLANMARRDRRPVSHTVTAPPPARVRPWGGVECPECGHSCAWVYGHTPSGEPWDYAACTHSRCGWSEAREARRRAAEFGVDDPDA